MLKKEKKEVTEGSPLRSGRRLLGRETPAVGSQRLVHNPKEGIVTSLAPARPFLWAWRRDDQRPDRRGPFGYLFSLEKTEDEIKNTTARSLSKSLLRFLIFFPLENK